MSAVLMTDTYFGLIAEFFGSLEYARTLSLISKYHHDFPQDERYNLQIVSRILSREFFDIAPMRKLMQIEHDSVYDLLFILHHFHIDFNSQSQRSLNCTLWMKRDFLSRWRYLTANNEVRPHGVKYWLKSMSSSHGHPRHEITEMIFHSNLNGEKNTLHVDSCTEYMNWSVEFHGDLPAITEFTRLLVGALDLNQNRGHINHSLFAWSLHYLCLYFENKLTDRQQNGNGKFLFCHDIDGGDGTAPPPQHMDVSIVRELSSLVAELILTLHAANFTVDEDQICPFHDALAKYSIARRLKAIWSRVMGEQRLLHFSSRFTLAVSSFFNCLMDLSDTL